MWEEKWLSAHAQEHGRPGRDCGEKPDLKASDAFAKPDLACAGRGAPRGAKEEPRYFFFERGERYFLLFQSVVLYLGLFVWVPLQRI